MNRARLVAALAAGSSLLSAGGLPLQPNHPVERDVAAADVHLFDIRALAGQYLRLSLSQSGSGLRARMLLPDGKALVQTEYFSPATLSVVTPVDGVYSLELRPSLEQGETGRLRVVIEDQRMAIEKDRTRYAAQQLFLDADRLRRQGVAEPLRASVDKFQEALRTYQAAGDREGEAETFTAIGRAQESLSDREKALESFQRAAALHHSAKNFAGEAYARNYTAVVQDFLGQRQPALDQLTQALDLARTAGDRRVEAITVHNFGLVRYHLGERQKALDLFQQALGMQREVGNRRGEATTLMMIGAVYDAMGEKQQAITYLTECLPLRRAIGDARDEANTLNNLGAVHFSSDGYDQAVDLYGQALVLWRKAGDRSGEAATLHNLANVYQRIGEYHQAMSHYRRALDLHRVNGYRIGQANTLNNLAMLSELLGEPEKAMELYREALPLHRATSNQVSEAATLTNMGSLLLRSDSRKALDLLGQALTMRRAAQDRRGEAATLQHIARAHFLLGESREALDHYQKALDHYQKALTLHRAAGGPRGEALALSGAAAVHEALGERENALDAERQALALFRGAGDRQLEAHSLYRLARLERDRSKSLAALEILESIRQTVFDPDRRSTFLASVLHHYELLIELSLSEGMDAAALEASERARARSLLELLAEGAVDIRQGVDRALLERERSLRRLLNAKAARQTQLLNNRHTREQAAQAAREVDALRAQAGELTAEIRASSPAYSSLTYPQPLDVQEIQSLLGDSRTMLLEYFLGERASYLWAVSATSVTAYRLPPRAEVEGVARRFHELASQGSLESAKAGRQISSLLLGPVAGELAGKRLVIVPDGVLHYIPFAALPLAVSHEVVTLPSMSTLAALRRQANGRRQAPKLLAVLADPVFRQDDPRTEPTALRSGATDGAVRLGRLIGSRQEASAIAALAPPSQRLQAFDFAASRATATSPELARYRFVHFATHGLIDSARPEMSAIVLSMVDSKGRAQDGYLRLQDIYNLKLPAELVVLSACQTALGKEIRGEGLVGLTRGFMYAGSERVLASLWKVDDRATAELMKHFYQAMLGPRRLRPAAALQAAQVAVRSQRQWSHPYYWGGFVLQGDWR